MWWGEKKKKKKIKTWGRVGKKSITTQVPNHTTLQGIFWPHVSASYWLLLLTQVWFNLTAM
jgi:hypothetical protein